MAAGQASEEAQPGHGEAPRAGGHRIPRGWGAGGRGEAPRRLLRASPAGRRPGPAGWGPLRPGAGGRGAGGRARAAAPDADGDRHDAPGPRPGSSSAPAARGGSAASRASSSRRGGGRVRGSPGRPCPRSQRPERAERRRRECPRRRDGRTDGPTAGRPPSAVAPPSPAASRPNPGGAGRAPPPGRVWGGCTFGRRRQQLHVRAARAPELRVPPLLRKAPRPPAAWRGPRPGAAFIRARGAPRAPLPPRKRPCGSPLPREAGAPRPRLPALSATATFAGVCGVPARSGRRGGVHLLSPGHQPRREGIGCGGRPAARPALSEESGLGVRAAGRRVAGTGASGARCGNRTPLSAPGCQEGAGGLPAPGASAVWGRRVGRTESGAAQTGSALCRT